MVLEDKEKWVWLQSPFYNSGLGLWLNITYVKISTKELTLSVIWFHVDLWPDFRLIIELILG